MARAPLTSRLTGAVLLPFALLMTACGAEANTPDATPDAPTQGNPGAGGEGAVVTVEDNHGSVEVPVSPERVVALDNHVFEILTAWDIDLVAAPKALMGQDLWPHYTDNDEILDVGSHREPNLESIIATTPDLVIGGGRFASHYGDIVAQNPEAAVVELSPRTGEPLEAELKRQVEALGLIFGKQAEADALVADLDAALEGAAESYNGTDTVVGLITSGGEIAYSAPGTGRSVGPLFTALDLVPAIEQEAEDTSHGDDISVEAIAQANPDWIIVLDRDGAGVGEGSYRPAEELLESSEALAGVTAVQENQIIYLSPDFYLTEDIYAYTDLYQQIAEAFTNAD